MSAQNYIEYLHANNISLENRYVHAIEHKKVEWLKYAQDAGVPLPTDPEICALAAEDGSLDCLVWLHEAGCPWDNRTCSWAASNGHLDCLQYAHTQGCPWDEDTCAFAAQNGHLECLEYAHLQGCPWDKNTFILAAIFNNLKCLQYAHTHGCPWPNSPEGTCSSAILLKSFDTAIFMCSILRESVTSM